MWDLMGQQPCAGVKQQMCPKQGNRNARMAHLEVRFSPVTLHPPGQRKSEAPVSCWAVYQKECGTVPQDETPVEWMLLTTVLTTSLEEAWRKPVNGRTGMPYAGVSRCFIAR